MINLKTKLIVLLVAVALMLIGFNGISHADTEPTLNSLSFEKDTVNEGVKTTIPVNITVSGDMEQVLVTFVDEDGNSVEGLGYKTIYVDDQVKNLTVPANIKAGKYTLSCVTLQYGSTLKPIRKDELASMGIEYTLTVKAKTKLNSILFKKDTVNLSETDRIPVSVDVSGDIDYVSVVLENENGNKKGPSIVWTKEDGDLYLLLSSNMEKGTTYYLTDIYLVGNNGQDVVKHYITEKSGKSGDGSILLADFEYGLKIKDDTAAETEIPASTENTTPDQDTTIAEGTIPKAGAGVIIVLATIALIAIGVIKIVKYKDLGDI